MWSWLRRRRRPHRSVRARRLETFFNERSRGSPRRVLFARAAPDTGYFYETLLEWIPGHWPEAAEHIELRPLPCEDVDWSQVGAYHAWLQDPVRERDPALYERARAVEAHCADAGVSVVNPVDVLSHSVRPRMHEQIAAAGVRTPRAVAVEDWEAFSEDLGGLSLPIVVRPAWGHNAPMILVHDRSELSDEVRAAFDQPVALEFVDVKNEDGLHRKFRYVLIDGRGIPYHMLASPDWNTRVDTLVDTPTVREQERPFVQGPEPRHDALERARRTLGMDLVAFDYGIDDDGELVVWEANPFPHLPYMPVFRFDYKKPMADRIFFTMLEACFSRAGISVEGGRDEGRE